jgi:hypothetical protein
VTGGLLFWPFKICISDSSSYPDDPNATVRREPNLGKKQVQVYAWVHIQDVNIIFLLFCFIAVQTDRGVSSILN